MDEINKALTNLGLDDATSQIDLPEALDEPPRAGTSDGKRGPQRLTVKSAGVVFRG
jgi:hypothetical protein